MPRPSRAVGHIVFITGLLLSGCAVDGVEPIEDLEPVDESEIVQLEASGRTVAAVTPSKVGDRIHGFGYYSDAFPTGSTCLRVALQRWSGSSWTTVKSNEDCFTTNGKEVYVHLVCRNGTYRTYVRGYHDGALFDADASASRTVSC